MNTVCIKADKYGDSLTINVNDFVSPYMNQIVMCIKKFNIIQDSNYDTFLIKQSSIYDMISDLEKLYKNGRYSNYIRYSFVYNIYIVSKEMRYRLKEFTKDNIKSYRKANIAFGTFSESLSPKIIQDIRIWLNSKKYKISSGTKEDILSELKRKNVKVNAQLCCKVIDDVNPTKYNKYWGVSSHKFGKRRKNNEIRQEMKEAFYKRERDYLRICLCNPSLRSLPSHVEKNIISFLY